jgi:hypothetical protein
MQKVCLVWHGSLNWKATNFRGNSDTNDDRKIILLKVSITNYSNDISFPQKKNLIKIVITITII